MAVMPMEDMIAALRVLGVSNAQRVASVSDSTDQALNFLGRSSTDGDSHRYAHFEAL